MDNESPNHLTIWSPLVFLSASEKSFCDFIVTFCGPAIVINHASNITYGLSFHSFILLLYEVSSKPLTNCFFCLPKLSRVVLEVRSLKGTSERFLSMSTPYFIAPTIVVSPFKTLFNAPMVFSMGARGNSMGAVGAAASASAFRAASAAASASLAASAAASLASSAAAASASAF